ncbi:hypothetical protein C2S53_005270 [Perilla frutescens var. hirtella]|uniref:F-box domain-containing protein n=1 Tax=Perilla frutescens var. hirtella TaxID=608512 RepID=A0AAD4J5B1_PERFH|nr:hypothetical protein C2S53_005270 [Perilla frutescens var. hirtella]
MSDVPSDLFQEILLRLPAESLLRFRAVCKSWRRTIDDPSFIKSHTTNQQSYSCTQLLIRDSIFCRLFSLSLDSLSIDTAAADHIHGQQQRTVDLTRIKNLVRSGVPFLRDLPTTSCHGLILIYHSNFFKTWVIWNPLTQEFIRLRDPDFGTGMPSLGVGIGYDYAGDDYKVVRIDEWYGGGKFVYRTLVYSLKSRSWKAIGDCPRDSILGRRAAGVYLNGALHWISENVIMALDLGTEEYQLVALPPQLGVGEPLDMYIDAFDGCLLFSCYYSSEPFWNKFGGEECLEGWIMKSHHHVCWIKLFSFGVRGSVASLRDLRPVAYLKSKGQVFLQNDTHFYCFDIHMNSSKKVTIHGLPDSFTCQNFYGSLVRLDNDSDTAEKRGLNRKKKMMKKRRSQTR